MIFYKGCSQGVFFTEALAEFQHVNCMIVRICEVKRHACCAKAETFTEAVASVASMVATPLSTPTSLPLIWEVYSQGEHTIILEIFICNKILNFQVN